MLALALSPFAILTGPPAGHGPPAELALLSAEGLVALATLTLLEVVLGIDNVVFLAILSGKLPASRQAAARRTGLTLALVARILLLFAIGWLMGLTAPLIELLSWSFSWKDLILLGGGLFLLAKATTEIHRLVEGSAERRGAPALRAGFGLVIAQIVAMDLVFSLDSVLTAVGMVAGSEGATGDALLVMVLAVTIAVAVMLVFAEAISRFIERHPSVKVLALAFLVLIGVLLIADGLGWHLPRGYVYAAMSFSLFVELLQLRASARERAR